MSIKKGDFIELDYTGKTKDEQIVFDTTDKKLAEEHNIFNPNMTYGPVVICVGEKHVIGGIDKNIEGKELGKYQFELPPEDAFGKKEAKLLQLIPTSKFKKEKINPQPGMQINVDGMVGTIQRISGGRTIIDFNHPLAGKDLLYEVDVKKVVTDTKEKLVAILTMLMNSSKRFSDVLVEGDKATVTLHFELPDEIGDRMGNDIKKLIPELKNFEWKVADTEPEKKE